jgi:AcrR family transcriptional regulator
MTNAQTRNRAVRAQRGRATRHRIVEAATTLFVRDGYLATTMSAIANQAGVAVQTLYLSFGSKVAILAATLDVAIVGDDEPVAVLERPWVQQLRAEPDGAAALGCLIQECVQIFGRTYPLYAVIRAAAAHQEVAELLAHNKQQRHHSFTAMATSLAAKQGFAPGVPTERAADLLYAIVSEETYGLLVVERGWPTTDWAQWCQQALTNSLFPPTPASTSRPGQAEHQPIPRQSPGRS